MPQTPNNTLLITGASHGIGLATAQLFEKRGWAVFNMDVRDGYDVGNADHVLAGVQECVKRYGRIDCLVNNAGRMGETRPLEETSLEDWESILRTNLTGMFLMARQCAPHLRKSGGSIVQIASTRAIQSEPDTFAYSASKGGVVALTHSLAASLAPVRVNSVSPGWIDVEGDPLREKDHAQHWAGRVGEPRDVAELVFYLAGAGFVTGADFIIDGGMTRKMIYV